MQINYEFFLIVAVAIGFGVWKYHAAKKRRNAMATLADRLGLQFDDERNYRMAERHAFLDKLDQGSNRYAFNILSGDYGGHPVSAFDYHFETTSYNGKRRTTVSHYISFYILDLGKSFPELTIAREGILSKLAQTFGHEDIDFESNEFSERFVVRSDNKKFAYDFCNARMIEYLLGQRVITIEVEQKSLALGFEASGSLGFSKDSRLEVHRIEPHLKQLLKVRTLMPEYLFAGQP